MHAQPAGGVRIPVELEGSVPRAVRLTRGGVALAIAAMLLPIAAVTAAILLSITYQRQARERDVRAREGATAQAEVDDVRITHGDHPRRIVTYRYEVGGVVYPGAASFSERTHRELEAGSLVEIGYVPSDPARSWMTGHEPDAMPVLLVVAIPLILASIAAAMAFGLRSQWTLLTEGRPALARVVAHKHVHRDKHRAYRVSYEFSTLSGATQAGSFEVAKNPPPVGTIVPIVYHRDKPKWSAKYPVSLVRPAKKEATDHQR